MAFDLGFNFRATAGFVTDQSFAVPVLAEAYPHTYTNADGKSINAGWDTGPDGQIDRQNTNDPRIAGLNYRTNSAGAVSFHIDLSSGSAPGAGTYTVDLAFGTAGFEVTGSFQLKDNATVLIDGTNGGAGYTTLPNHFIDATLVDVTATVNWTGATASKTFSTTTAKLFVAVGLGASGSYSEIAHFRLTLQAQVGLRRKEIIPIEWRGTLRRKDQVPDERLGGLRRKEQIPYDWIAGLRRKEIIPVEWRGTLRRKELTPIEWLGTLILLRKEQIAVDWLGGLRRKELIPDEWLRALRRKEIIPIEWLGTLRHKELTPIEWRGFLALVRKEKTPVDWAGFLALVRKDRLPIEWLLRIIPPPPVIKVMRFNVELHTREKINVRLNTVEKFRVTTDP